MASIVPPLDFIPKLPAQGVELVLNQLNAVLDQLQAIAGNLIQ